MSHDTRTNAIAMSINLQATARHSNSFGKIGSVLLTLPQASSCDKDQGYNF
jgi:hypothetical protein